MKSKEIAEELVKITFEKIANSTNYISVKNDGGKTFFIIEKLSKNIAKDFIKEIISELKDDLVYAQSRIEYFENVKNEIDAL